MVLVRQQEIYPHDFHPLKQRQVAAPANCISQCSYVNQALTTCADDACFCPAVTVGATICSQCYATVNVTAASIWSSVIGICSAEFAVTGTATFLPTAATVATSSTPSFPAVCTSQCALISQALVLCTDDFCFCPTATSVGSFCSQCLATVNATQASDIGAAMSICSSEFGNPGITSYTGTFGSPTTSPAAFTEYNPPTRTSSNDALLGAHTSSTTPTGTGSSSSSPSGGLSKGTIGAIAGGFVGLMVIGATVLFCCIRRPKTRDPRHSTDPGQTYPVAAPHDYPAPNYPPPKQWEEGMESTSTVPEFNDVPSGRLRYPDQDEGLRVPEPGGPVGGRLSSG